MELGGGRLTGTVSFFSQDRDAAVRRAASGGIRAARYWAAAIAARVGLNLGQTNRARNVGDEIQSWGDEEI